MQNSQPFSPLKNPLLDSASQAGGYMLNSSHNIIPPSFGGGTVLLPPFQGVEFQPSEVCPRNFIIFDQAADSRSKIMFHPAIGAKFCYGTAADDSRAPFYAPKKDFANDDNEEEEPGEVTSSVLKEDSEDIDALLSFDDEYGEEVEEEEEVSTARTYMNYGCNSPDSCSNYEAPPSKKMRMRMSGCDGSERKRMKMRKMVMALRGIIPGANQMNSVAVLDEAVRYLKSLKFEVQKLGGVGKKL